MVERVVSWGVEDTCGGEWDFGGAELRGRKRNGDVEEMGGVGSGF